MYGYMCIRLSAILSICLSVCLFVCLHVWLCHFRKALTADKHVSVEYPITVTSEAAIELFALADKNGKFIIKVFKHYDNSF